MKFEVRYGAIGGQGLVTAGLLLCRIAVKLENKHATASPTYTAAVRGGATKVDIIISDDPVLFSHATAIDFCFFTDQRPYSLYMSRLKPNAVVVADSNLVTDLGDITGKTVYSMPIINETEKEVGNIALTSVVGLSITQKLTGVVSFDNMLSFVKDWAPKNYLDLNLKALDLGIKLSENCVPIKDR
ncbi:MAG: 2-oxoacid:acceptor oxidoreductase family protein [Oscillospiraceae bacterium]|nr:2-oxoacid:acceptor oxidoreductase family protein [Oscillospiraceae bacterium]